MNIRDFEYLIAVSELKNFSRAAEKCFISQPALSQQVKKIEDQLGFNIFERSKKSIITTSNGQKVIKHAKSIISYYTQIKEIGNEQINIKIGLIPTICPYLLPLIVDKLHQEFPEIRFYFLELKTEDLFKKLKDGEIDFGVIAYFDNLIDEKTQYSKSYDEEFLLTLPKTSKLSQKDFPKIMEEKKLILLEEGNCMSDNIKKICDIYHQNSFSEFYATNIETVKNMVRINNGAALLPKLSCLDEKNLKTFSFVPKKSREVGMVWRKSFEDEGLAKSVGDIITQNSKSKL
ncbi:MAG: LysR family hydrogen peroxide-inducible transcriptional activator [Rickettsiales bacterium]|jgi:LysR family hydrogen peroxide-inducible transcriptional activator